MGLQGRLALGRRVSLQEGGAEGGWWGLGKVGSGYRGGRIMLPLLYYHQSL